MPEFDWIRVITDAGITLAAIYYGRWSQRRDDRKARQRAQELRLAQALARAMVRRTNGA